MENLKAEQVKKALECCNTIGGCKVCPYSCNGKPTDNGECGEKMSLDALALINSQEQRIKDLEYTLEGVMHSVDKWLDGAELEQDEVNRAITMRDKTLRLCEELDCMIDNLRDDISELTEENERLRANEKSATEILNFKFAYDAGKADTVRKMQTLIEEKADSCDICLINSHKPIDIIYQISKKQLDQIAKEMLEGEK